MSSTLPPVSAIADVLALWGLDGWLSPPLAPVVPASGSLVGKVRTMTMSCGDEGPGLAPLYDVLSDDLTDRFVIIAGAASVPGGVFGEILACAAQQRGALGALVDGSVRDRTALLQIGLPVYATDERVVGPNGRAHITAVDHPVAIGDTTVDADDLLVVDAAGCVRLAAAVAREVLDAACRYADAEDRVVEAMREGSTLATAYLHKKTIVDELRR
jgi:4-hydroxy-4-methyl-2-oxoglutarate aldolase